MIDPILSRETAPDHAPGFWSELEDAMASPTATATMPAVETTTPHEDGATVTPIRKRSGRRLLPALAAAAVLVLAGLGLLLLRPMDDATTEVVVAPTGDGDVDAPAPAAAGEGEPAESATEVAADTDGSSGDAPAAETTVAPARAPGTADGDTAAAPTPLPTEAPAPRVEYPSAPGNDDTEVWLPEAPLPVGSRFLATWEDADLSWFGAVDPGTTCADDAHMRLRLVNAAGLALPTADHDPGFSGTLSHFTMSPDTTRVAWVSACDGQLEFHVARLSPVTGQLDEPRLAWVGSGSETAAEVFWDGTTVTLNTIQASGSPVFVDVDPVTGLVEGTGLSPDPLGRDPWIAGATANGAYTYWNAPAVSTCDGATLYVRTPDGAWQPAMIDAIDVASVVAFDIDQGSSQVAFADACPGINIGRFFLGTLRADGRISSVRTIDISPFATGHVSLLDWTDGQTVRLHTDNSNTGGGVLRFDYQFDDGRDAGVLVQVD